MDFLRPEGHRWTALFDGLHTELQVAARASRTSQPSTPASAPALFGEQQLGVMGELHPLVHERYDLPEAPLLAAELDLESLLAGHPGALLRCSRCRPSRRCWKTWP